jgi:hypothetical protein
MLSPVGGGRAFECRPAFQRRTCGLRNPRLTRLTDKVSSIYRNGSSTERRIQGGTGSGCGQRSRKYTAFYLHLRCGLLLEFCIIVFILAIAAQLMVALNNNSTVRKLLRVSSRRARIMPGGKRDVSFDAFQKITSKTCTSRTCRPPFVGAFHSWLGCMHETRSRAAAQSHAGTNLGVCTVHRRLE